MLPHLYLNFGIYQGLNGILADEMGLGKTIQAMAFLAHLAEVCELIPCSHHVVVFNNYNL